MIIEHIIIEDKLVLLLDFNFEIASFKNKGSSFKKIIHNYIKTHDIKVDGKKILLVFGGVVLATFTYLNNDMDLSHIDKDYTYTTFFSKLNNVPVIEEIVVEKVETKEENKTKVKDSDFTTIKNETNKNITTKKSITSSKSTTKKSSTTSKSNVNAGKQITTSTTKNIVTVYRSNGSVVNLDLEEYVIGVVAAEMPASFNLEALKVQAILARTYALKSKQTGKKLTDTVSTQVYIDTNQMKNKWGSDYSKYYNKIKKATTQTKGMYIIYNGSIIDAVYHSTSNGYTEDSTEVWGYSLPYLKSVESSWDKNVSSYQRTKEFKVDEVLKLLGVDNLENIEIISHNSSGRVSKVKVGDTTYSGVDFRSLLSLRSTDFDIELNESSIKITTRGYGHGVGLSQYGANEMANMGYSYLRIISHYYKGIKINKLIARKKI